MFTLRKATSTSSCVVKRKETSELPRILNTFRPVFPRLYYVVQQVHRRLRSPVKSSIEIFQILKGCWEIAAQELDCRRVKADCLEHLVIPLQCAVEHLTRLCELGDPTLSWRRNVLARLARKLWSSACKTGRITGRFSFALRGLRSASRRDNRPKTGAPAACLLKVGRLLWRPQAKQTVTPFTWAVLGSCKYTRPLIQKARRQRARSVLCDAVRFTRAADRSALNFQ